MRLRRAAPGSSAGAERETAFFRVVLILKGIDGLLELVGGLLLLVVRPATITGLVQLLTQHELSEDPHDLLATHLLTAGQSLGHHGAALFGAAYLLGHGLIKLVLVWAVLRERLWAYPWMIAFLLIFIGYQTYRLALSITPGLLLLTLFDVFVAWLTAREYRRRRTDLRGARRSLGAPGEADRTP